MQPLLRPRRIVGERPDQRLDVLAGIERADVEEVRPVGRLALHSLVEELRAFPDHLAAVRIDTGRRMQSEQCRLADADDGRSRRQVRGRKA